MNIKKLFTMEIKPILSWTVMKYLEMNIIKMSLKNSDGWKDNGPMFSHLCAPIPVFPAIRTAKKQDYACCIQRDANLLSQI